MTITVLLLPVTHDKSSLGTEVHPDQLGKMGILAQKMDFGALEIRKQDLRSRASHLHIRFWWGNSHKLNPIYPPTDL